MKNTEDLDREDKIIMACLVVAMLVGFVGAPAYTSYKLGQSECATLKTEPHYDRHRSAAHP